MAWGESVTVTGSTTIAVVFLVAAVSKFAVGARRELATGIKDLWPGSTPPGRRARTRLAGLLIAGEAAISVALASGVLLSRVSSSVAPAAMAAGLTGAAVLLASFVAGQTRALSRGNAVSCACFGTTSRPVSRSGVARAAVLLAIDLSALALMPTATGWSGSLPGLAVALVAGCVTGLVLVRLDDVADVLLPAAPRPRRS